MSIALFLIGFTMAYVLGQYHGFECGLKSAEKEFRKGLRELRAIITDKSTDPQ